MPYRCPLCKKQYEKYKWFVKHISNYSAVERKKIFYNEKNDTISLQGSLNKFFEN